MERLIKKAAKILYLIGIALVTVIIAAGIAVQAPGVQTRAARKAISMISDKIDGRIEIGKIPYLCPLFP